MFLEPALDFVAIKEVVFLAAAALGALKAADKKNCHSDGDQDGQSASV